MIEIRKGTERDTEAFLELLASVRESMEHPEWFFLDPPEEVRKRMANGTMELWVAMDGERMAGAIDILYPGKAAYNYGHALGFSDSELFQVVNMDNAAVYPDYRGQGLQKRLMQAAERELAGTGKHILLCTVHPDNQFSLKNVLSQGYQIQKTVPMYGSVRHILRKNIQ